MYCTKYYHTQGLHRTTMPGEGLIYQLLIYQTGVVLVSILRVLLSKYVVLLLIISYFKTKVKRKVLRSVVRRKANKWAMRFPRSEISLRKSFGVLCNQTSTPMPPGTPSSNLAQQFLPNSYPLVL